MHAAEHAAAEDADVADYSRGNSNKGCRGSMQQRQHATEDAAQQRMLMQQQRMLMHQQRQQRCSNRGCFSYAAAAEDAEDAELGCRGGSRGSNIGYVEAA